MKHTVEEIRLKNGARGLLIGIGIGALLMGVRVMLGLERPWGE